LVTDTPVKGLEVTAKSENPVTMKRGSLNKRGNVQRNIEARSC